MTLLLSSLSLFAGRKKKPYFIRYVSFDCAMAFSTKRTKMHTAHTRHRKVTNGSRSYSRVQPPYKCRRRKQPSIHNNSNRVNRPGLKRSKRFESTENKTFPCAQIWLIGCLENQPRRLNQHSEPCDNVDIILRHRNSRMRCVCVCV